MNERHLDPLPGNVPSGSSQSNDGMYFTPSFMI